MNKLEWKPEYSVGNELLDRQHQKLFEIFNRLIDSNSIKGSMLDEDFHEQLHELAEYTRLHITTENELMARYGYPDRLAHNEEHEKFSSELTEIIWKACQKESDKIELLKFIYEKWVGHIIHSDQKFKHIFSK